ncbi:MAG: hypothetical protein RIS70_4090 [Planctomycetota bacterium]
MSDYSRTRRQILLRAVEGYLELMTGDSQFGVLDPVIRDRLGQKALAMLEGLDLSHGHRARAFSLAGELYRAMERYAAAIEPLKQSVELVRDNLTAWLSLGWCYKRTQRIDLAIHSLEEAMEVAPSEAIVHYNLACYWSLAGNPRLSIMYLSQAFDLDPRYRDLVCKESDFDPIREHPEFQALTSVIV